MIASSPLTLLSILNILLLTVVCERCHAQAQVKSEFFMAKRSGSLSDFNDYWKRLVSWMQRIDTMQGRVLIRKYSKIPWDSLAIPEEPDRTYIPDGAWVCDFASDYVDLRNRQDWLTLKKPKRDVDLRTQFSTGSVKLFDGRQSELVETYKLYGLSIDRDLRRSKGSALIMSLPKKIARGWPTVLDFRMAGWFSENQWMYPTNQDPWLKILETREPFSCEKITDELVRLNRHEVVGGINVLWEFDLDAVHSFRPIAVRRFRVLRKESDDIVVLEHTPLFGSRFVYKDNRLMSVVFGANEILYRCDFDVEVGGVVREELFDPSKFVDGDGAIYVSEDLKQQMILELENPK